MHNEVGEAGMTCSGRKLFSGDGFLFFRAKGARSIGKMLLDSAENLEVAVENPPNLMFWLKANVFFFVWEKADRIG